MKSRTRCLFVSALALSAAGSLLAAGDVTAMEQAKPVASSAPGSAPPPEVASPTPATPAPAVSTNSNQKPFPRGLDKIVELAQSGVDTDAIVAFVNNSSVAYNLPADEIIRLHQAGVPSEVITALLRHGAKIREAMVAAESARQRQAAQQAQAASSASTYSIAPTYTAPAQPVYVPQYVYPPVSYYPSYYPSVSYSYSTYPYYYGYYGFLRPPHFGLVYSGFNSCYSPGFSVGFSGGRGHRNFQGSVGVGPRPGHAGGGAHFSRPARPVMARQGGGSSFFRNNFHFRR